MENGVMPYVCADVIPVCIKDAQDVACVRVGVLIFGALYRNVSGGASGDGGCGGLGLGRFSFLGTFLRGLSFFVVSYYVDS